MKRGDLLPPATEGLRGMVASVAGIPDFHNGNVTNILFCHTSSPSGKLFSGLKEPLSMASRRLKHKYFQR